MAPIVDFDPAPYTRIPNLDVPSLITLARQLRAAAPPRPPLPVKQSLAELDAETQALEAAYGEHLQSPAANDPRPIDQAADNAWGCLHGRLSSYAALPADLYPQGRRAAELVSKLFPTGLTFLKLEYGAQWAESEQRLQRIKRDKLKAELDALVGPDFMAELYRCHALYTEMVGVSRPRSEKKKLPDLRALRLRTQQAVSAHAIQLLAMYLHGGEKVKDEVRPSFAAIDAYREKVAPEKRKPVPGDPAPPAPPAP
jgi:hypothetical protein